MTNSEINKNFLAVLNINTKTEILNAVATHYGITVNEAYDELVDDEAEHILDYLTGNVRSATSVLFQRHNFARM